MHRKKLRILLQFSFLFAVTTNKISGQGICDKTKITVLWSNGTKQCLACIECRRGWGSTYSCGDVIKGPRQVPVVLCVRCRKRYTFSPSRSANACQLCTPCKPNHQMTKKCTRSADTKCGGCKKGYYKYQDPNLITCEKCSPCCGDAKDERNEECAKQGLHKHLQCSFRQDRNCSLSFSSQMSSQQSVPNSTNQMKTMASTVTMSTASENNNPIINIKAVNNNSVARSTDGWSIVGIVVGVLAVSMLLIIVCVVGGIWYQRYRKERYTSVELLQHSTSDESSIREQQCHEPGEGDKQSGFARASSSPLKKFIMGPNEQSAYNDFCKMLNTKRHHDMEKHFHSIGRAFDVEFDTTKTFLEDGRGAAQALFDYLDATRGEAVTMEEIAVVLDRLTGREIAAKMLRDADKRLKQKAFAQQQES